MGVILGAFIYFFIYTVCLNVSFVALSIVFLLYLYCGKCLTSWGGGGWGLGVKNRQGGYDYYTTADLLF